MPKSWGNKKKQYLWGMETGYELLLPEGILDYFEVKRVEKQSQSIVIHLDEKNSPPEEYRGHVLESKGYYPASTVRDFPLRGKSLVLSIRRRHWHDRTTGDYVMRDWNVVAEGTRLTAELAAFLKALHG